MCKEATAIINNWCPSNTSFLYALQIDDEMERHSELLKEVQNNPTDVNAIVTRRRKDFTDEFFCYLTLLSETDDSLEGRDGN